MSRSVGERILEVGGGFSVGCWRGKWEGNGAKRGGGMERGRGRGGREREIGRRREGG